ncbi:hypothetical protein [Stakelama saccharophila]|uniref:Phage shock protein B n=1 Tax=Stakelama saccharophila TaxID=3075605 RepID=A0ABZ0B8X6_9SPHN|nr:hypothetical protein [Stakelama sp. W311]WNO52764.1 hypothetical protein RPR59_09845 [Stakelama sp. W311]
MQNADFYMTMAIAGLAGLAMITAGALIGWRGWLTLKTQELANAGHEQKLTPPSSASARIEIADLKERIRKLEAIAAGVDL